MIVRASYDEHDYNLEVIKPALLKLSDNFTLAEMANNAGDPTKPQYWFSEDSEKFITALQFFRELTNQRVIVNSGYRQPEYNRKIGGASDSRHIFGQAADIRPLDRFTAKDHIQAWAEALAFTGQHGAINIYKNHEYYHMEANEDIKSCLLIIRVYSTIGELTELKTIEDKAIQVRSYLK